MLSGHKFVYFDQIAECRFLGLGKKRPYPPCGHDISCPYTPLHGEGLKPSLEMVFSSFPTQWGEGMGDGLTTS
ncbi:MAG TPA: hypothetical protein PLZ51_12015, partial [Aggregatilineales bacterium]|nr:hypothetical protein [Aggregatilineales bacterium]